MDQTKPGKVVYPYKGLPYDLYIGRQRRWPEPLKRSFWANPYKLKEHGGPYTLAESLYLYELRVRSSPEMLERLHELVGGKTLACWCAPKDGDPLVSGDPEVCHGQVLLRLAEEL